MTKPIKSDKAWYVLGVYASCPALVLSLEPETYAACERSIAWQRIGQGQFDDWRIGYVHDGAMIGESGETIALGQTPYTDAAWSGFLRDSGVTMPAEPRR